MKEQRYSTVVTVTTKGQATIPTTVREMFGISLGGKVKYSVKDGCLTMRAIPDFRSLMGTFKSKKKYSKAAARKAYVKDIIKDFIAGRN